jgi:hypothetical protein
MGNELKSFNLGQQSDLPLNLPAGVYFYEIVDEAGGRYSGKIMVK